MTRSTPPPRGEKQKTGGHRRAARAEATRSGLLAAGRALFGRRGYTETGLTELAAAAGATTGAIYHHFGGKIGLFRAVVQEIEAEAIRRVGAVIAAAEPKDGLWEGFLAGVRALLDLYASGDPARIATLEAPAALGHEEAQRIREEAALGPLSSVLERLRAAGEIEDLPVLPLASLLLTMLAGAGAVIARSDDPARTRDEIGAGVMALLCGLRRVRAG